MKFTKGFMVRNSGCYSYEKLMDCSFMKNEEITAEAILNSEIPLKDKFWFFCYKVFGEVENQRLCIEVAKTVLPIWENVYPEDKRLRKAIEAAIQYREGCISLEELNGFIKKAEVAFIDASDFYAEYVVSSIVHACNCIAVYANANDSAFYSSDLAITASDNNIQNQLLKILKSFVNES